MHPAVERLTELVAPGPPRFRDWPAAERELGTTLPTDYRQLVETYGGGIFDETLWLLDPACPDDDYHLLAQAVRRAEILERLWEFEARPVQLEEPGTKVLPWAYIEGTGAMLYWLVKPEQEPDEWTVMFNEGRGPLWEHHHAHCASFLLAVLTRQGGTEYFPELPAAQHQFDSNDAILGQ
ncbi:SMI1/KNR4 family protein [Streptomyces sp. NRRL S-4]|uniref:SMI1/KNR4 family protein n=1 Tax=Streptomyces sp. NRRL S-4 TaxID=1519471 RepID=UPI0006B612B0|nr:hypothetical protein ADK82_30510 [Streptomyces sp. NRRL S-4]